MRFVGCAWVRGVDDILARGRLHASPSALLTLFVSRARRATASST